MKFRVILLAAAIGGLISGVWIYNSEHDRISALTCFVIAALAVVGLLFSLGASGAGVCRVCGCTDDNCQQCIDRTGVPCAWTDESRTLCTACEEEASRFI